MMGNFPATYSTFYIVRFSVYFSVTIYLQFFFWSVGKYLVFHHWTHVLESTCLNLCIHWKPAPHNVKTLFMLRMYLLALKVSLVISVRMSSGIIYHLTYLILTHNKSYVLSHCLSTLLWMCSEYRICTFKIR